MQNDRLFSVGLMLCKVLMGVLVLALVAATLLLCHIYIEPAQYAGVHYKGLFEGGGFLSWNSSMELSVGIQEPGDRFALSKIEGFSLFLNYLQISAILLFALLIVRKFMAVIRAVAVRDWQVRARAVTHIARYLLAIYLLTSFTWVVSRYGYLSDISFRFKPLLLVIAAFVVAYLIRRDYEREQGPVV